MILNIDVKPIYCFKIDKNLGILIQALKSLQNLHFNWSLLWKYITFDLNKYRGVIFHDTEGSCKI